MLSPPPQSRGNEFEKPEALNSLQEMLVLKRIIVQNTERWLINAVNSVVVQIYFESRQLGDKSQIIYKEESKTAR